MGNYRFRLLDMMPNAWFYKLKDMSKSKNNGIPHLTKQNLSSSPPISQPPYLSQPRKSYYYTSESIKRDNTEALETHFPPSRSSKRKTKRKTIYKPSQIQTTSLEAIWFEPEPFQAQNYFESSVESSAEWNNYDAPLSFSRSSSCSCQFISSATDIIIDIKERSCTKKVELFNNLDLPPIRTKIVKSNDLSGPSRSKSSSELKKITSHDSIVYNDSLKTRKESAPRRSISKSSGVKVRANYSPNQTSKRYPSDIRKSSGSSNKQKSGKKNIGESFAIVKASFDPEKDFRESMMEMIVENKIHTSMELEELLASYLSLNSVEYHGLIIKAFEEIWFEMPEIHI